MTSIAVSPDSGFRTRPAEPFCLSHQPTHASRQSLEARREGQQSDIPRLLDRLAQPALVPRAYARQTARNNLPALGHEALQQTYIAVGDRIDLLRAELADLLAAEELPAARAAAAGCARGTRRTWTARTCVGRARGVCGSMVLRSWCAVRFVSHVDLFLSTALAFPGSRHATVSLKRPCLLG